jgi:mono/diheme cytochrome c family protein
LGPLLLVVGVGLGAAACGGGAGGASAGGGATATAGEASAEDVAAGRRLFVSTCATCHGPNAEGVPRLGKNLHDNAFVQGLSLAGLAKFFAEGRPATHPDNERRIDMPARGGNPRLTEDDLRLLAVYVRSIQ